MILDPPKMLHFKRYFHAPERLHTYTINTQHYSINVIRYYSIKKNASSKVALF